MNAGDASGGVLLDTCALIWLANGDPLSSVSVGAIVEAGLGAGVFVSPISAWEIGLLSRPRAGRALQFLPDATTWFARLMAAPTIKPAVFNGEIAIAASMLPEPLHGDPADRLLIATARHTAMPIVTRDSKVIGYGDAGHIQVIAC